MYCMSNDGNTQKTSIFVSVSTQQWARVETLGNRRMNNSLMVLYIYKHILNLLFDTIYRLNRLTILGQGDLVSYTRLSEEIKQVVGFCLSLFLCNLSLSFLFCPPLSSSIPGFRFCASRNVLKRY